tara:strand:- start:59 stop:721 length:663 start_codon:yes stop_codon:yes gene_type:complete
MGSILSVSEIRGLTSGGNANTISVASGHKISGAAGSIVAPGQIVQCVSMHLTTRITMNHGSNTTADLHNVDIIPKAAGSKFLLQGTYPVGTSDDEGSAGLKNPYYYGIFQRSVAGGSYANCNNTGTSSQGGASVHIELSPNRTGDNTVDYLQGNRYRNEHKATQFFDTPSYTLGQTINYKLTVTHKGGETFVQFGEPAGYSTDDNYQLQPYGTTIWEIAQ